MLFFCRISHYSKCKAIYVVTTQFWAAVFLIWSVLPVYKDERSAVISALCMQLETAVSVYI
jgi:hypothetical protein